MKIEKIVKLQKQSKEGTISMTLPKIFVEMFGYKPGDKIKFILDTTNECLTIKKI